MLIKYFFLKIFMVIGLEKIDKTTAAITTAPIKSNDIPKSEKEKINTVITKDKISRK